MLVPEINGVLSTPTHKVVLTTLDTANDDLAKLELNQDLTSDSESDKDDLRDLLDAYGSDSDDANSDCLDPVLVIPESTHNLVVVLPPNPPPASALNYKDDTRISTIDDSPKIHIYTSYGSGINNIVSKTNRMELILQGSGINYSLLDITTDERAKRVWRYGSKGRLLPGVVRDDEVIGDLEYIEELNEYGEIRQVVVDNLI